MIASTGYNYAKEGKFTDWREVQADPNWKVYQIKK
jgi:tRNA A37 threonylcarbamoyltransferase TsaD